MAKLKLEIVTAERVVYSAEDVDMVVAPGVMGELGILPRHAPLLTTLKPGVLRVKHGGQEEELAVSGGFLQVMPDKVTVLADAAERAEEIDEARAEEARQRALRALQERPAGMDAAQLAAGLHRSLVRLRVARRRRGERPGIR